MILFVFACSTPGVMSSFADELAREMVMVASPPIHRAGAIGLLVGELALSEDPRTETSDGSGARMLGAGLPVVEELSDGDISLTFEPVGVDGELGTLVLEANVAFGGVDVVYQWPNGLLTGKLAVSQTDGYAAVKGTLLEDIRDTRDDNSIDLDGFYPYVGLSFDPWGSVPLGGFMRWSRLDDSLELLPAENSDLSSGWPALATGTGWTHDVVLDWP